MTKKVNKSTEVNTAKDVMNKLDGLYQKGIEWTTQYNRTNATLYLLLAHCLEIYGFIKGKSYEGDVIKTMLKALADRGFTVPKHPRVINLIVRYVFNTERRRVYAYARALNVAISDGVQVDRFAAWVEEQGGVEEVASKKGKTEETMQREATLKLKVDEARDLLISKVSQPLAVVDKDQFTVRAGGGEYTLLIGKTDGQNQTRVLCTVPDVTSNMIVAAIQKIANALIKDEKTNAAKEVLSTRDASIKELVKTVKPKVLSTNKKALSVTAKRKPVSTAKKKSIAAKQRTKVA
jgi:hypothetical protein